MNFKDNPDYEKVFTQEIEGERPINFYIPKDIAEGYHLSRIVAAQAQNIYSTCGATAEVLRSISDTIINICNDTKKTQQTIRTDIGVLANQIKYRTQYPVDDECGLRMAAIYIMMEGEDPNKVSDTWIRRKVQLCKEHPDMYAFFLTEGIRFTPAYVELLEVLSDSDYFQNRQTAIKSLSVLT